MLWDGAEGRRAPEIRPGQHIARQLLVLGWCRRRVIRAPKTRFQVKAEYRENYFLCNRNLVNSFYFDSDTMILCRMVVTTQMATLVSLWSVSSHSSGAPCSLRIFAHSWYPYSIAYFNGVLLNLFLRLVSTLSSLTSCARMAGRL